MEFKEHALIDCLTELIDYRGKTPKKLGGDWKEDGDYRAISAKNIKNNELVNEETIKKVNKEIYDKWMKKEINKGDILLTSEAPLGETYYWDSEEKIVLSQRVYGLRANDDILTSKYLYAYMQSKEFSHELTSRESGTTVTGIRQSELGKVKIKVPIRSNQNYIGDLIYNLNHKIQLNKKIIRNLELLSQALFKHWFIEFEFPNEKGQPYKSSGGEMLQSELGEISSKWTIGKLGDISFQKTEKVNLDTTIEKFNYIGLEHMPQGNFALSNWENSGKVSGIKSLFNEEDILFGKLRPYFKKVGIAPIDGVCSTDILVINSKESQFKSYLFLNLLQDSLIKYSSNTATGTRMPRTSWKLLSDFKIVLPDKDTLVKFEEIISPILQKTNLLIHENNNIQQLRDSLLPKLFSGEIEIPQELDVQ